LVFVLAAADILGLTGVTEFVRQEILPVVSNVIIAALILIAGVLVANILERVVRASIAASGVSYANFIGALTRWIVIVFAFWTVFLQLNLAIFIPFSAIIIGIIAMLAIAGGLAFGLGGKDQAAQLLADLRKQISEKK
jgi:Gpi18-like mannosyltransferase